MLAGRRHVPGTCTWCEKGLTALLGVVRSGRIGCPRARRALVRQPLDCRLSRRPAARCPSGHSRVAACTQMGYSMLARGSAGRRFLVEEVRPGRRRDNTTEYPKLIQASDLTDESPLLRDVPLVREGLTWVGVPFWERCPGPQLSKRSWRARLWERPVLALSSFVE